MIGRPVLRHAGASLLVALVAVVPFTPSRAAGAAAGETWRSVADPARSWRWTAEALEGPDGQQCRQPRHELRRLDPVDSPAARPGDSLRDIEARLSALGLRARPLPTQRIACEGLALSLMLGAGDRGAMATARGRIEAVRRVQLDDGPLSTVQQLLRAHAASPMGHKPERVGGVEAWITPSLHRQLQQQLFRPRRGSPAPLPAVPVDPWTGAEENPERLWLETAEVSGDTARVPVHAELGGIGRADHRVTYVLLRRGGRWLVDDVHYLGAGVTLRDLLAR